MQKRERVFEIGGHMYFAVFNGGYYRYYMQSTSMGRVIEIPDHTWYSAKFDELLAKQDLPYGKLLHLQECAILAGMQQEAHRPTMMLPSGKRVSKYRKS